MYIDEELIEDKFYQTIDQFNEKKIPKFYLIPLNKIQTFYNGNGRTCTKLFSTDDIIVQKI